MFNGDKFVAIEKSYIAHQIGFKPDIFESYPDQIGAFVSNVDKFANVYGYEFHCFSEKCVIFKRI